MLKLQLQSKDKMIRLRNKDYHELVWACLGRSPLELTVEFPTDWHESRRGWIHVGVGFARAGISFPWKWLAPDHMQCQGPTFGLQSTLEYFRLHWGQDTGRSKDPRKSKMWDWPWVWQHDHQDASSEPVTRPFQYVTSQGEVQSTVATIKFERFYRKRLWWPRRSTILRVDVSFDREMGERVDTWKGGTSAISFMVPENATPDSVIADLSPKLQR